MTRPRSFLIGRGLLVREDTSTTTSVATTVSICAANRRCRRREIPWATRIPDASLSPARCMRDAPVSGVALPAARNRPRMWGCLHRRATMVPASK